MNEGYEFDYTVTKKAEGKYLLMRILMIIGYVVFGCVFFFGLFLLHLYQFMAFIVLVEWILVYFTWRFVSLEYRYETSSGHIKFFNVYGGKLKREILDLHIKSIKEIAPISELAQQHADKRTYSFLSSERSSADVYYALFESSDGEECVVRFEATQKALKVLRFYNPKTVVTETRY